MVTKQHLFSSYCYSNKAKHAFFETCSQLKIGGKITILDDDELEDLGVTLDYNTGCVMPNNDVVLLGFSSNGISLQIVPVKGTNHIHRD